MTELYTKISKELNEEIERIAKERGIKKTDVARELLENGLEADGMISEAKDAKAKVLALDTVKGDVSELKEEIKNLKAMLESKSVSAQSTAVPAPTLTKEEIIEHLKTCKDPNCQYGVIAAAALELERMKEPDLSKGFFQVGDKTFTMDQVGDVKQLYLKTTEEIIYRRGQFSSAPFRRPWVGMSEKDFDYRLERALEDAAEFEKGRK